MDKCTHEVRKQRWKNIINQCMQRPQGMTVKQWLDENNICEQTYYHWLKRIRQETYECSSYHLPSFMLPCASLHYIYHLFYCIFAIIF